MHVTVVLEDHAVVMHRSSPVALAVGVKLFAPKFNPEIVTDVPPDVPPFIEKCWLTVGASNVNRLLARVPTTAPTVTTESCTVGDVGVLGRHAVVVADVHAVVAHAPPMMAWPVGVKEYQPKFSPLIVTDTPPDVAPFDMPTIS